MAEPLSIIVLEGDETGQELLEQAIRVLDPEVTTLEAELTHYDLSLNSDSLTTELMSDLVVRAASSA